jgi:hypothetical protein
MLAWDSDPAASLPHRMRVADWLQRTLAADPSVHRRAFAQALRENSRVVAELERRLQVDGACWPRLLLPQSAHSQPSPSEHKCAVAPPLFSCPCCHAALCCKLPAESEFRALLLTA